MGQSYIYPVFLRFDEPQSLTTSFRSGPVVLYRKSFKTHSSKSFKNVFRKIAQKCFSQNRSKMFFAKSFKNVFLKSFKNVSCKVLFGSLAGTPMEGLSQLPRADSSCPRIIARNGGKVIDRLIPELHEFLRCRWIFVAIRVILHCKSLVSMLDFLLSCPALHAQYGIVVFADNWEAQQSEKQCM